MNISAPKQITLIVSVLIALIALVAHYGGVRIPLFSDYPFGTLLISYLVLLVGNLVKGI